MVQQNSRIDDKLHWYKDAIIYELHIKAFRDSNGDGIGDFRGLLEKLDYMQELGVTAIWVLPFYPSPLKDDGYDIADYYSINPNYGNLEDFKEFLQEAHKRQLKVITELVINHTSDQHPWFQRARSAPKDSPERNFYVWTDDPNQYKDVRIIFQDFEASNWTWDPVAQQYYWHRFFHHQPDLNYDNPIVHEEIFKIIDYWCAMGVDGFRLDAVPYLYEREGTNGENLPETHAFLKKLRAHIDEHFPGTVFLAEANMWPEDSASYFGEGDECHMNYHFPVMPRMFMALQMEDRYPITDIFDQTPAIPETCQWAIFLRNHDELTLEMVTDEERDFMYKVYAKDPKARINLGIRHRLAPLMDNNRNRIELMNSLLFSLPGTPVIYYGDEIGMGDNFYLGDRDGVRTPMQWSPDRNAGFSPANPHQLYLPIILDPEYNHEAVNVEMQRRNTSSLLWFMKRLINMRKHYKAFGRGDLRFLPVDNSKVLAFTRSYEDETLLVVVNLSKYAQPAELDLRQYKGYIPIEMFSKNRFPGIKEDSFYFFPMSPHSFQWFVLEKAHTETEEARSFSTLEIFELTDILKNNSRQQFETKVLPEFLQRKKWFHGKHRHVFGMAIAAHTHLEWEDCNALLMLIEVSYESGLPEYYQLAVTHLKGQPGRRFTENYPEAVLAYTNPDGEYGIICDAFFTSELHQFLFSRLSSGEAIKKGSNSLHFNAGITLSDYIKNKNNITSNLHTNDVNNTSITYDNTWFLKMYRKVDAGNNPDVEISNELSMNKGFLHIPKFTGTIEWRMEKGSVVLGMMQSMIENHGDGRSYMLERLHNYIERIEARDKSQLQPELLLGSLAAPQALETLPEELQTLLGTRAAEQARLIGQRTGELHLALASINTTREFQPEPFSLHYQRSLFSSMQSLVRESYQHMDKKWETFPELTRSSLEAIRDQRETILNLLKRIYQKKLDIMRIRIHGTYDLRKILLTGKDISIQDFVGDPIRSFSERRIKRSPIRDIADMICSFHYVAYEGFFSSQQVPKDQILNMLPFARQWAFYMSGFFTREWLDVLNGQKDLVPEEEKDFEMTLKTFVLERAIRYLNYELVNRPEWAIVPIHIITDIIQEKEGAS